MSVAMCPIYFDENVNVMWRIQFGQLILNAILYGRMYNPKFEEIIANV
jgi:hypothetical protein